jgi:filamentous hemagglutinin family protein
MGRTGFDVLHRMLLATSCLVAAPLIAVSSAWAGGPSGAAVVVGQATVTAPSSTSTVITQTTNKALITWSNFSVSAGSTVTFDQPNSKSITVNRVTGTGASDIYGDLLATGRIWLINANGILFGKGSEINVGALIATTSDISDEDFRKGRYNFGKASGNAAASVVNQGTIHAADHGSVVLSGPSVSNQGVIQANLGTVVLGGADAFTVDLKGDNLIRYQVSAPVSKTPVTANGSPAAALVSNSGTIAAHGGEVLMTARAAHNVEDNVINNTGIVEATSVSSHDGEIDLDAGPDGTVNAGGTLDVSGKGAGETGGTVAMTGGTVNVVNGARIDASGDSGGGSVRIGGDFHGKGPLPDASQATIGAATIDVDAIHKGNGGTVAVWSNNDTNFSGTISAKGGARGGNGGYVETSGGNLQIGLSGFVDTSAVAGKSGSWLLDPTNIVIATGGTTPLSGGTLGLGTDPEGTDTIAPSTITTALQAGTDVLLEASNDITVSNDVIYSSANNLSLLAENSISVDANIQNTKASGGGGINLIAGWNGTTLPPSSLTAPGVFGAQTEEGQGTITIGGDGASGNVAVGSASGLVTVAGTNITLDAESGYAQIGYHGTGGGGIALDATGDLTLISGEGTGLYAQIGNGDATGTNAGIGNVGGDINVQVGGDSEFYGYGSPSWLGNVAGPGATETGNVTLVTNSGFLPASFVVADLGSAPGTGGSVTLGFTTTEDVFIGGVNYSSPNDFTFLAAGNLDVQGSVTNSGTGALTLVAGWDGQTLGSASQLRSAGAYGAGGAVTTIGGEDAEGDVDVGSLGGTTTVLSGDLVVEADNGYAQLGSHATGGSAIVVDLMGDLTLTGNSENTADYAQIGNGDATGTNETIGSVTGSIALDLSGTVTFNGYSGEGGGTAWLGNVAGTQGTDPIESGNVTLIAGNENDNGNADLGDMINANLGTTSSPGSGGNVTIGFTDPEDGTTVIDNAGISNTPNALTVLSTGNIVLSATLENQGTGSLTFISGWDTGVISTGDVINTVNADSSLVSLFTGAAGSYGQNGGNIEIGGPDADGGVSIGSKSGTTTVLADNLIVDADHNIAQLGYDGAGDGNIDAFANGDVEVVAASDVYAQIGNGGFDATGSFGGNVSVTAATGNIDFDVTGAGSYVQIGNGGFGATGDSSGNVSVTAAAGDIDLLIDGTGSSIQVGNGGGHFNGDTSGNVGVAAANGNVLADVAINGSYIQIGNGGFASTGNDAGEITLGALDDVELTTSDDADSEHTATGGSYVQVGNGGPDSNENATAGFSETGDIAVTGADVTLSSSNDSTAELPSGTFIGNGGGCAGCVTSEGVTTAGSVAFGGNITVTATNALDMDVEGTHDGAEIGNGGDNSGSDLNLTSGTLSDSGTITINVGTSSAAGTLTMTTGTQGDSIASIGNGGFDTNAGAQAAGGVSVLGDVDVTVNGGTDHGAVATLDATAAAFDVVQIGSDGSAITNGTVNGNLVFAVDGTATLSATPGIGTALVGDTTGVSGADTGTTLVSARSISGMQPSMENDIQGGDVTLEITGTGAMVISDPVEYSSTHNFDLLVAGDVDIEADVENNLASGGGAIDIVAGWDGHTTDPASLTNAGVFGNAGGSVNIGGTGAGGNAGIGDASGTLTVAADNIVLQADNGFAQLGYNGAGGGNIDVVAAGDLTVDAASADFVAQLGNNADLADAVGGNLSVAVAGNVTVEAVGDDTIAEIGNLGGTAGGTVSVTSAGDMQLTASGANSSSVIGNLAQNGDASGGVTVQSGGALSFYTTGTGGEARIGNIATSNSGGVVDVSAAGDITLSGSSGETLIGDTGVGAVGGTVQVTSTSGEITLDADGEDAAVQIGSSENGGSGSIGGAVSVIASSVSDGDIVLNATGSGASVQIGNGDLASSGSVAGDIAVTAGDDVQLTNGPQVFIGNLLSSGAMSGSVVIDAQSLSGNIAPSLENDLPNGDFTLALSGDSALAIDTLVNYSSANALTVSNGGDIVFNGSVQNAGSGNITINSTDGDVLIGGAAATGNVAVGSAGGLTSVSANNVTLDAVNGYAQLGFNGASGGDITVVAQDTLTLTGGEAGSDIAQIGNGASFASSSAGGNVSLTAQTVSPSGSVDVAGNSADIVLTGEGSAIGTSGDSLQVAVNDLSVQTNGGNVYISSPTQGLSIGVGEDGIDLGAGDLVLAADGPVTQSDAIAAAAASVSTTDGAITLTNAGNAFDTATLSTSGTDNASLTDASDLTIAGATIGGNLTLSAGGAISQSGAIDAKALSATTTGGAITLTDANNAIASANLAATGDASLYDTTNLTVTGAAVGDDLTLLTKGNLTFVSSVQLTTGAILAVAGWDGATVDPSALTTTGAYGNNGGSIVLGGASAAGNVAVGSASGSTTLAGDNVSLVAQNGFAQLGRTGSGSGDIDVYAHGAVTLSGGGATGAYAQIGNGGYKTAGNSSGAIMVTAGGAVALTGGGGEEAYAQIGDGGAESNANKAGYSNDAIVTVSGQTVTLDAGKGDASYAQIGNGGYKAGEGLTGGTATNGGAITVHAVESVSMSGNGQDAYAQIGNGGDQVNTNAASGASGAISGDIVVAVSDMADGSVDLTAGSGANAYVQIGNGGYSINAPTSAPAANFTDSGTITVSDLSLIGSDTGANGYAQIGNGDASLSGVGDVSGDITIMSPDTVTVTDGTAANTTAMIGGATGDGTVTGTITGYSPPSSGSQQQTSTIAALTTQTTTPSGSGTNIVIASPLLPPQNSDANSSGLTDNTTASPSPLQQMADASDNGDSGYEGTQPSDTVAVSLGQSLNSGSSGHAKSSATVTHTLIPGMLKQVVMVGANTPHGVPPADQDFSSWGNEALWQW